MYVMKKHEKVLPIVSFFCGPGGPDLGFRQEGFKPFLALDVNTAAIETYNWNNGSRIAVEQDLSKLTCEEFIALIRERAPGVQPLGVIGGPPCQSFSQGNVRKKKHDPRAQLGLHFARLVHALVSSSSSGSE